MNKLKQAEEVLKEHGQEHVINVLKKLEGEKQKQLIDQVLSIDFEELEELYQSIYEDIYTNLGKIEPIIALNPDELTKEEIDKYVSKGVNIVKNNKFAIVTMAGRSRNKTSDTQDQKGHIK